MTISIEALIGVLVVIGGGFAWIIAKLDKIGDSIADIRENRVSHAVCTQRRDTCPCVKDLERLDKDMAKTDSHIIR